MPPKKIFFVEWVRKGVLLRPFFFPPPLAGRDGMESRRDFVRQVKVKVPTAKPTYRVKALAGKGKGVLGGSVGRCRRAG
jgi:hypothetical protein